MPKIYKALKRHGEEQGKSPAIVRDGGISSPDVPISHSKSKIIICISGFIANLAMLIGLLMQKHTARKTVNVFICNQTVLDLVATLVSSVRISLLLSGYLLETNTGVLRMLRVYKLVNKPLRWLRVNFVFRCSLQ